MDYEYYGSGAEVAGLLAVLAAFGFFMFIFAVAAYVVNAIFLMKLLKNAGHKNPVAAWVPIWNTVSLMQIGGIKQPWIWALIFVGGSLVAGMIPYVGFILSLGILVAAVIVTIYLAKGVQAGVGHGSTGGIVLAVLLPIIWVIWISLASDKSRYDRDAAIREGSRMPWNWFGESDLYEPFGVSAPAAAYAGGYQQSAPSYGQPQGFQAPAAPPAPPAAPSYQQPTYGAPQPPQAPVAPAAAPEGWSETPQPPTSAFTPPAAPATEPEGTADGADTPEVPTTPTAPPRFSAPLPPRSREDFEEGGEGNRTI